MNKYVLSCPEDEMSYNNEYLMVFPKEEPFQKELQQKKYWIDD